jgi:hypothetical protein
VANSPPGPTAPELVRVADEDQLAARLSCVGDEALQVVGARHRRLVEDDHVPRTEAATPVLHIEEEAGQGVGTKSRFVGQHAGRDRRGREPDGTVAGGLEGLARRAEGAGLPRARRTDEKGHLLAATEQLAHSLLLIGSKHRAGEDHVHAALGDEADLDVSSLRHRVEDACLAPKRGLGCVARRPVAFDRAHTVAASERIGRLGRERRSERADPVVADDLVGGLLDAGAEFVCVRPGDKRGEHLGDIRASPGGARLLEASDRDAHDRLPVFGGRCQRSPEHPR